MSESENIINKIGNSDPAYDTNTSENQRFSIIREIRDYTYKDVVFADTKAGFALTIVTVSLAACVALFDKMSHVQQPFASYINFCWVTGLVSAAFSVLCAMLTLLPRSYISHEMANNPNHWVHMQTCWRKCLNRRFLDAFNVIIENIWQKQTKGTSQSLTMLMNNSNDQMNMNNALLDAMKRALLVQNLKFLWVGKALLFAFISFSLISISLFLTLGISDYSGSVPFTLFYLLM